MAKTLRRRRARAARFAAAAVVSDAPHAPPHVSDKIWGRLEAALDGLLRVLYDDNFLDLEHLVVRGVQIFVDWHRVRPRPHASLSHATMCAADAIATLCVIHERLRRHEAEHLAFWERVLASEMVNDSWSVDGDIGAVREVARHTRAHGLSVVLSWSGKALAPTALRAIRSFVAASRLPYELRVFGNVSPAATEVCVGLDVGNARISEHDIVELMEVVSCCPFDDTLKVTPLCDPTVLRKLNIHGAVLGAREINALARSIRQSPRRLEKLGLKAIASSIDNRTHSVEYIAAFKSLLSGIFQTPHCDAPAEGVWLALEQLNALDPELVRALCETLRTGSRGLRTLTLENSGIYNDEAWFQLGRLFFTPSETSKRELDISTIGYGEGAITGLRRGLEHLVIDATPKVIAALAHEIEVVCRLMDFVTDIPIERGRFYRVQKARVGLLNIVVNPAEKTAMWIPASSISCLRVGGVDLVRSCFNSLLVDGNHDHYILPLLTNLMPMLGPDLERLSLRYHVPEDPAMISDILAWCPHLQQLNFEGSILESEAVSFASSLTDDQCRSLRSLHLWGCNFSPQSIVRLRDRLSPFRDIALQSLCVTNNNLTASGLTALQDLLREHSCIQLVGVDGASKYEGKSKHDYADAKARVAEMVEGEWLVPSVKMAFLGVLCVISAKWPYLERLDQHVTTTIFEFAGRKRRRTINWY